MDCALPCRLRGAPFQVFKIRSSHVSLQRCEARKWAAPIGLSGLSLPQLMASGAAWADEISNDLPQIDVPSSLPDSLPAPESLPSPEEIVQNPSAAGGSILDLFSDNPILVAGLLFLAAVPVILSFFGGGSLGVKKVNAAGAIEGLSTDPNTVLIDIRSREEVKEQGNPDLSSTKKKAIILPFTRLVEGEAEQIDTFVESFGKLKQIKGDTSIILLDSYGKEAPAAAKLLAKLVGRVYYVQDGAVGARGWKESDQPWREPGRGFLNLDSLADDFKSQPTFTKAGVAVGAVGVASAILFQEAGAVVELAALAAAGAFALPRFLGSGTSSSVESEAKEVIQGGRRGAKRAASQVEDQAENALEELDEAADEAQSTDLGAKAKGAADDVQESLANATKGNGSRTAQKVEQTVEDAANSAQDSIKERSDEAKAWIDDWKKAQTK